MTAAGDHLLVGIFVGGRGERMGGVAKGLLRAPDSELSLIERALGEVRAAAPGAAIVLVGSAPSYAHLGLGGVADAPAGIGPLGGLLGLLQAGSARSAANVLALACDLPFIDRRVLARLITEAPGAAALVTETRGVRNPLVARYKVSETSRAASQVFQSDKRSLQAVLDALAPNLTVLELSATERDRLEDWDTPDDIQRARGR